MLCDPDEVRVDMAVSVTYEERGGIPLPQFQPNGEGVGRRHGPHRGPENIHTLPCVSIATHRRSQAHHVGSSVKRKFQHLRAHRRLREILYTHRIVQLALGFPNPGLLGIQSVSDG